MRAKAVKIGVGSIVTHKELGYQGYLATMKVLCTLKVSMRHGLKEVPPKVCHVPLSLKMGDVMSANEATRGRPARRNRLKT